MFAGLAYYELARIEEAQGRPTWPATTTSSSSAATTCRPPPTATWSMKRTRRCEGWPARVTSPSLNERCFGFTRASDPGSPSQTYRRQDADRPRGPGRSRASAPATAPPSGRGTSVPEQSLPPQHLVDSRNAAAEAVGRVEDRAVGVGGRGAEAAGVGGDRHRRHALGQRGRAVAPRSASSTPSAPAARRRCAASRPRAARAERETA